MIYQLMCKQNKQMPPLMVRRCAARPNTILSYESLPNAVSKWKAIFMINKPKRYCN